MQCTVIPESRSSAHLVRSVRGYQESIQTIWCLCYKTNELKKKKQKEKHWACLHRLKKKGVAFVAAEHGSVEPSRSTRHDVTCSNRRPGLRLRHVSYA